MIVDFVIPICSMYGIFTYTYPKNHPNVGKYSIHGASGICWYMMIHVNLSIWGCLKIRVTMGAHNTFCKLKWESLGHVYFTAFPHVTGGALLAQSSLQTFHQGNPPIKQLVDPFKNTLGVPLQSRHTSGGSPMISNNMASRLESFNPRAMAGLLDAPSW